MHDALGDTPDREAALVHFAKTVDSDDAALLRTVLQRLERSRQRRR